MDNDELESIAQPAQEYLQSLDDLASSEQELVKEYQDGSYSNFADDQADLTGYKNDMSNEVDTMMDNIDDTPGMEDPGGSDYDMAKYILDFCQSHQHQQN